MTEDCEVCGAEALAKCAKCGAWLCSICIQNPCDNEHFIPDEDEETYLDDDNDEF